MLHQAHSRPHWLAQTLGNGRNEGKAKSWRRRIGSDTGVLSPRQATTVVSAINRDQLHQESRMLAMRAGMRDMGIASNGRERPEARDEDEPSSVAGQLQFHLYPHPQAIVPWVSRHRKIEHAPPSAALNGAAASASVSAPTKERVKLKDSRSGVSIRINR